MDLEHFQELNKQTLYLVDSLRCKKKKILCIESCTGGLLSSSITSVENISDIFEMGLISYSNESKISLCKIPERLIIEHGAVSEVVSKLMSEKILNFSKLKPKDLISISSTGISGPKGGTKEKPLGTIFISISHDSKTQTYHQIIKGENRKTIQIKSVIFMIEKLNNLLKKL